MSLPYPILFERSFQSLPRQLRLHAGAAERNICIVTDSHVAELYLDPVRTVLADDGLTAETFVFPAGEEQKNLDTICRLYEFLVTHHIQRSDLLIALGGGVTGDMTGFAAATYLRGIDFVQVPTTLLSQVDSSVGGKTGVDLGGYKNMVGAFYQPVLVYMNMSVLQTLPADQYASGIGEVIKTALIRDAGLFADISSQSGLAARDPAVLAEVVRRCCAIKAAVVEEDPYDRGIRAILNFGHTIGHAIEKEKQFTLLHGQCVALGMLAAGRISVRRGLLEESAYRRIRSVLQQYDLPLHTEGVTADAVISACYSDKKRENGKLRFILLQGIGTAVIEPEITEDELLEGMREIL